MDKEKIEWEGTNGNKIKEGIAIPEAEEYIGTKLIKAAPMNLGDYNKLRGWDIPKDEDPKSEGYLVTYPDHYLSWSPKEIFEYSYKSLEDMRKGK